MHNRLILLLLAFALTACSAIELREQMSTATAAAELANTVAAEGPVAEARATLAAFQSTAQALSRAATQSAATLIALETAAAATPLPTVVSEAQAEFTAKSADTLVYGRVPIDSDRLNIIAALAFDRAGQLIVSTRAGEIYRLSDSDDDGLADDTQLIFADEDEALGQVSGMFLRGESLILINGERLSQLQDRDADGVYETVTRLSQQLPADQNPLLASNSIAQAPDGRLFTADLNSGEILRIVLRE